MKALFVSSLVTLLTIAQAARAQEKPAPTAPAAAPSYSHDGTWKPIAAVLGGMKIPEESLKQITLKVSDGKYEVTVIGEDHSDKGTCTYDESTEPKRMTLKSLEGPNKGKTFHAIYHMKDEVSMRVCYDLAGGDFPKEFKAPKGTMLYLAGYRRQQE
jgi:uncharacterized protein (TIGR03067 family)